jgi:outer membrane protein assembly factor BamB
LCLSGFQYAETYHSTPYRFNVDILPEWDSTILPNQKSVIQHHPELNTTINVTAYYFKTQITANALQKIRMGNQYDGWEYILERKGTQIEQHKSNCSDMHVALYKKEVLDPNLIATPILVGEYYFVTGNNGYIVTIETDVDQWSRVQPHFEKVLDSFWLGTGNRLLNEFPRRLTPSLPVSHYTFKHNRFSLGQPNLNRFLEEKAMWEFNNRSTSDINLVAFGDFAVLNFGNRLLCISLLTYEVVWEYVDTNIRSNSAITHHHLVSFIQDEGDETRLVSLDIASGQLLNQRSIPQDTKGLLVNGMDIFVHTNRHVFTFDAVSKEKKWSKSVHLDPTLPLLLGGDHMIYATPKKIVHLNPTNMDKTWVFKHADLDLVRYLMTDKYLIIELNSSSDLKQSDRIIALDLQTGKQIWSFSLDDESSHNQHMRISEVSADDESVFVLYHYNSSEDNTPSSRLQALTIESGEVAWISEEINGKQWLPHTIISNAIVMIMDNRYVLLDKLTGEIVYGYANTFAVMRYFFYQSYIFHVERRGQLARIQLMI